MGFMTSSCCVVVGKGQVWYNAAGITREVNSHTLRLFPCKTTISKLCRHYTPRLVLQCEVQELEEVNTGKILSVFHKRWAN